MKTMADGAGLEGRKTNHSARKTMISRLVDKNVNPLHIAQLSGHKNLKSLDSYSKASEVQQKAMSHILSESKSVCRDLTNVDFQPRSTTDLSSAVAAGISCSQQSLPTPTAPESILPGLTIHGESVNFYFNQLSASLNTATVTSQPKKRKV